MPKIINLRVITNEGTAVSDEAVSIRTPGDRGYMGVLFNHAPLVTIMNPGKLIWRTSSGEGKEMRVGKGMLEVAENQITLLTESVSKISKSEAK